MYIGAGQRCESGTGQPLGQSVGVVLADLCLYMHIGAGQSCGDGTGRPLLVHAHWCWPELWGWYWPTSACTCTLVLARAVGMVLADLCLYMHIGAGQRCGDGTGRPPNLSMTCTSKILKSSRIFDLCKLISHHGQEPKYLKQLKNDKESVGFLMVLMREPAGACPGHVQKGRPTLQALITEPAGSGPWTMVCTRRQADTSGIDNRVGRIRTKSRPDQDHVVYKQAGRYFRH
ncbi:hypothetical protein DEU56DRAFT_762407 [Suillus clintonianus]|uniref:uncharacterized protein n=1 Tax=Suillus clintonianus TaxID=1904413 RepID=UPI001B85E544|nr:uncharacterized protein DEU56DRAFT_762407 [Suillus clintonianus]KAG2109757.1 hypothetical protein DEU56DRAFT_762407 [Suillus clintonianus]